MVYSVLILKGYVRIDSFSFFVSEKVCVGLQSVWMAGSADTALTIKKSNSHSKHAFNYSRACDIYLNVWFHLLFQQQIIA